MKKIGLVTTLNTNIGDDFIREGIILLLEKVFDKDELDIIKINKHKPFLIYKKYNLIRFVEYLPKGKFRARNLLNAISKDYGKTVFDDKDIIIQCGTPVIWPGCSNAEWVIPIWHNAIGKNYKKATCLNLAAGSCFPWENQPEVIIGQNDKFFLKSILNYCKLITTRDKLAKELFRSLGYDAELLPCTAFLVGMKYKRINSKNNIVLINYMEGGGHYDWGQKIDSSKWRNTLKEFIKKYRSKYKFVFLAHNQREYDLAFQLEPTLDRTWPKTSKEYFDLISNAKTAICNRMHASVAMAGLGIPSIAVGTDTRLKMPELLGLPIFYVKDITLEKLEISFLELLENLSAEKERLKNLQEDTFQKYISLLQKFI